MKLQLALDLLTIDEALRLLNEIGDVIDIVEIGTPLIIRSGVEAITSIKTAYPHLTVLADLKIVDAGAHEAKLGFEAGADIVTVLGVAHDKTIQDALRQAEIYNGQVMVDLITIRDVDKRAGELDGLGCHYICVHTGSDAQTQGQNPLQELAHVQAALNQTQTAVAGGISPASLARILPYEPAIVVVGSFITGHSNPRRAALEIREQLS